MADLPIVPEGSISSEHNLVPDDPAACLSFAEGCALLRIGRRLGWSLVNRGELPHLRVGRLIRFRRSSLTAWIARQEKESRR